MNGTMSKKNLILVCALLVGVFLVFVVFFFANSELNSTEKEVEMLATQYYDALIRGDYKTAFSLLYRTENTMFTDEFIVAATQEEPPIYYKVEDIKELSEGIYEVSGTGESDNGEGKHSVTNYVVYYNSKYNFVIHWSDVPTEIYDFREIIGY